MKLHALSLVLGALAGSALPAHALTTLYTSEATFLSAAGTSGWTNTFTGPLGGSRAPSLTYSQGGYAYTISAPDGLGINGDVVGVAFPTERLTVSFTSGNVFAVGGNFFVQNASFIFISGGTVGITLSDGTTTTYAPATFDNSYRGFVSDAPITSLQFASSGPSSFNGLDNLTIAGAVPVVPEPGIWALFVAGLGVVGLTKRRLNARRGGCDA